MTPLPKELKTSKYENAILYFVKYCNNKFLGATKLNKLLYYLDFISFRDKSATVTGDKYIHLDYGPVPKFSEEIISKLVENGRLSAERVAYEENGMIKFELKDDPDLSVFTEYEKTLLDKICHEFTLWPTGKIVNQTHLEAPWFYSDLYNEVDLNYAKDIEFFTS